MAKQVWVNLDTTAVGELLNSSEMMGELMDVGNAVAAKAGSGYEAREWDGRNRAAVNVVDTKPGGLGREAKTGNLARAISGSV